MTSGKYKKSKGFQSTLPVWGATKLLIDQLGLPFISIHAPRVGSDSIERFDLCPACMISIHAPRVGSDHDCFLQTHCAKVFQSTLPVWGATRREMRTHDGH